MLVALGLITAFLVMVLVIELVSYGIGAMAYVIINAGPALRRLFKRKP